IAKDANLEFSRGLGSNADIAVACFRKAIHFQRFPGDQDHMRPVDLSWLWPNLFFIHTQIPQDTRDFVSKFLDFACAQPEIVELFSQNSDSLVHVFLAGPRNFEQPKKALEEAYALLLNLGKMTGINIVSQPHQQIAHIAQKFGGAAKPSGAGGGDICIALVEARYRKSFATEIWKNGFNILNLSPNENQLRGNMYQ
ncbi:MAG: hypothetical protein ACREGC_01510, partial [Minisyncoccia bacterium]